MHVTTVPLRHNITLAHILAGIIVIIQVGLALVVGCANKVFLCAMFEGYICKYQA